MTGLYAGLMSGTSLDGVDAVLARPDDPSPLVATHHIAIPADLRLELMALNTPGPNEIERAASAANRLTELYGEAVREVLAKAGVTAGAVQAIGCHGQTIRHQPQAGYTVQIVNGALLAERTGIAVVCDFRSRDIAAGGEGAPLVPAFHRAVFHRGDTNRVVVNIGGMSNLTYLPAHGPVFGFDTGPGNVLMDGWIERQAGKAYDNEGRWAATGVVMPELLSRLQSHDYFSRRPPKSTGRETFDLSWVERHTAVGGRAEDVQATLLELTAWSVTKAIADYTAGAREIYLCGGGALNDALAARIASLSDGRTVATTESLGIPPLWVEALAFAWLARCRVTGVTANIPEVTGASGLRVLGAIYAA